MPEIAKKRSQYSLRVLRTRSRIHGTTNRPRLSVHVSNHNVVAQLIDDDASRTLAYVSSADNSKLSTNLTEKAQWVGEQIGKKAQTAKIKQVVLDRGGKLYHGRIKTLAEAARKAGLEF